jgi:hypothetical protein
MRGILRLGLAFVLVLVLAVALTGCQQASDQAAKSAVEAATGVKVDQSGGNVTVTGPDGSSTTVGQSLPAGMPTDFPVYAGKVITSGKSTTSEGTSYSYSMETADGVQAVSDWYKAEFEKGGWKIDNTFVGGDSGSETSMMTCTKGTMQGNVTAGMSEGKTTIIGVLVVK